MEVTVSGGKITAIEVVEHSDTGFIADPTFAELIPQIVEEQALVDVKSGATMSSRGLFEAVSAALSGSEQEESGSAEALAVNVPDGVHRGVGQGFNGPITVEVTVSGGKITAIEVVEHSDTGFIADPTFAELIPQIVEEQALVDVKSGATMSSSGLLDAVSAAVSRKEAE